MGAPRGYLTRRASRILPKIQNEQTNYEYIRRRKKDFLLVEKTICPYFFSSKNWWGREERAIAIRPSRIEGRIEPRPASVGWYLGGPANHEASKAAGAQHAVGLLALRR